MSLKIVVCPDSFKGSISATDACDAIERGLGNATVIKVPIADGGEGTLEALAKEYVSVSVTDPDSRRITACYGIRDGIAIIEMARAAGLTLSDRQDAASATTYGVGELITDALCRGIRDIMLTVGGSATNDGGCGMAAALGIRFLNKESRAFLPTGGTLADIDKIDMSGVDKRIPECNIIALTDVKNPLLGENGATYVYGRQKGADDDKLSLMERGMEHYAHLLEIVSQRSVSSVSGAGAGGGLLCPFLALGNITIRSGIEAVLDTLDFDNIIKDADIIITGEGRLDIQSLYGKAISGVANAAAKRGIPVYCLVGDVRDREKIKTMGIKDIFALTDISDDTDYLMKNAAKLLTQNAKILIDKVISE